MINNDKYTNIECHAYDIYVCDEELNKNGDFQTEIRLWCLDRDSNPLLVRINDFPVMCKIELPQTNINGDLLQWNQEMVTELTNNMKKNLYRKEKPSFIKCVLIKLDKLYYYTGKKYDFLIISFLTIKSMYETSKICRKVYYNSFGGVELKYYEMDIDIYNKMFSVKNLSVSDKFTARGKEIFNDDPERISKEGGERKIREFRVSYKTLKKLPEEAQNWFSFPKICSWDLETYSHNPRCFPQKGHPEDEIFSVSLSFQYYMKPETLKNIMIIIGPCKKLNLENTYVYCVKDEEELIDKFFDIIIQEDPELMVGYNIFSFDFPYINQRIIDVGNKWKNIGRTIENECVIKDMSWASSAYGKQELCYLICPGRIPIDMLPYIKRDYKLPMYNLNYVSEKFLGDKKVDLKAEEMFKIHKQFLDIEEYIEDMDYNNIEEDFQKKKEKGEEKWHSKLERLLEDHSKIIHYNIQDTALVIRLVEKLNVWISLIELSCIMRIVPIQIFTRGQQKRCIAQLYHTSSHKGIVLTTRQRDPVFFVGGYVEDPDPGFWPLAMCFDFNSLYPSIMIAYNICFTTLINNFSRYLSLEDSKKPIKIEDINVFHIEQNEPKVFKVKDDDQFDYSGYKEEGAEEDNEEENEDEKVLRTYDYGYVKNNVRKGILPEILENLLAERGKAKKKKSAVGKIINSFDKNVLSLARKNKDLTFQDITDKTSLDLIAEILGDYGIDEKVSKYYPILLKEFNSRKVTHILFDSRQLALKISANSLYGFLGAQRTGKFSLIEGSMSVCFMGRKLIIESGLFFQKHFGAHVVYGDTDSTMVTVPSINDDPKKVWALAEEMEKKINGTKDVLDKDGNIIKKGEKGIFVYPLYLEAEKMMKSIFIRKKNYMYMEYDRDGNIIKEKNSDREELNSKGIVLARRDNYKLIKRLYENMARARFSGASFVQMFDLIIDEVLRLIHFDFKNIDDISINRSMGSNYKSETYPLAVLSEQMKEIGRPIQVGERFKSVVVTDHKGRDKMGYKMRPVDLYLETWETSGYKYGDIIPEDYKHPLGLFPPEEIDPTYYIENLSNSIDTLMQFSFYREKEVLEKMEEKKYVPQINGRLKEVSFKTPMKLINLIIKDFKKQIKINGISIVYDEIKALKYHIRY